ncbi:MAG TPA: helix-turn-helix domain-containing protein [Solirubrobacteraceae bacterium]|nr:helix-turn-helix domain-containing protein [Solirubrobacteraceae bacterium]
MPPTRERIVAAARRLFAQRGYRGTSVGDIESAAGLSPRSGALYKHFASKQELLEAVMAEHTAAVDRLHDAAPLLPLGDLRAEMTLIAHLGIDELRREHELTRIVMKEGERFPELAAAFREAIVDHGHRLAAERLASHVAARGGRAEAAGGAAAVLTDALVGYTLQELLFGPAPGGVEEERFLAAWVDGAVAMIEALVDERSPAHA